MLHLRLFIAGVVLIAAGLLVSVVLQLGGPWPTVGLVLEAVGVVLLGVNIALMLTSRRSGEPPR